jgi:hypothetical protein
MAAELRSIVWHPDRLETVCLNPRILAIIHVDIGTCRADHSKQWKQRGNDDPWRLLSVTAF